MVTISRKVMAWLVRDQQGASAVEYAILVGCIGAVLATGASKFGTDLSNTLGNLITSVHFTG